MKSINRINKAFKNFNKLVVELEKAQEIGDKDLEKLETKEINLRKEMDIIHDILTRVREFFRQFAMRKQAKIDRNYADVTNAQSRALRIQKRFEELLK